MEASCSHYGSSPYLFVSKHSFQNARYFLHAFNTSLPKFIIVSPEILLSMLFKVDLNTKHPSTPRASTCWPAILPPKHGSTTPSLSNNAPKRSSFVSSFVPTLTLSRFLGSVLHGI